MPQQIKSVPKIAADVSQIYRWSNFLETIRMGDTDLEVWESTDENDIKLFFIQDNQIAVELAFTKFGRGIQENLVIQNKNAGRGLARDLYLNYLLDHYDFILSDSTMTDMGLAFWKKLWRARGKNRFYLYDSINKTKSEITDEEQMDQVFGPEKAHHYKKFVIVR